ncbi:RagB/SusD family nutrient uptake outer membrane protein [Chitinophagaceae bacterium 26-R-25]|nr:RagB/SusD family nutrient uptake outer membrane protein [Chitinophagaceae bacterium 26-R-25]
MKKQHLYINWIRILFAVPFFLTSCKKDFLDKQPLDAISSESFWKTQADADMALAGCYKLLAPMDEGYGALTPHFEGLSDNAYCNFPWEGGFTNIAKGIITSTSGGALSNEYKLDYQGIAASNFFLANIDNVNMDASLKDSYKAEAKTLRAYYYFRLSEIYGGVILSLTPENINNVKRPKSTKDEVVKTVLDDLEYAIGKLNDDSYSGHVVKGTAQALKAKVLLYNAKWSESAAVSKAIIDGGKFKLSDDYNSLFIKPGQMDNPEIMFSARYQATDAFSYMDLYYTYWQSLQPIQSLVDAYETVDGSPVDPANPYNNRDPRLKKTILLPGDPYVGSATGHFEPFVGDNHTGFLSKKFADPNMNSAYQSTQDFVFIRYADVLLMYAEAQNEAQGPDATVYAAINKVRGRAGVNMPSVPAGLSQDQMRSRIRQERRIEFAMEGTRYFDLKRWHIADQVLPLIVDPGGAHRVFEQKHYLWPFPQSEIDILKPALIQNTGY